MTGDEAIEVFKKCVTANDRQLFALNDGSPLYNACLYAISALEQEPCDDAISREAVLGLFYDLDNLYERIKQLPSVHPSRKGHWTSTVCYARTDNGVLLMGFECSECGKITFISPAMHTPKGCPFCMADMRGAE